jgi:glycosyltransferase involved in cell wall biosynthesis
MEEKKLISVIVPIYNMASYLEKCLDSIVSQSYQHLEIILVDDGSKDGSGEICDRYAAKDNRIKVIHRKNGGVSAARNSGLNIATGEYLGFVDSDDWIEGDMYQFLIENLTFDKFELPNDKSCTYRVLERAEALELLLQDRLIQSYFWCKLFKRDLFNGLRMPEGKTFEDTFTHHLIFEKAQRIVLHNFPKYHYVQRSDSIFYNKDNFCDFLDSLYERARYYFARGEERFFLQAVRTYFNVLYDRYNFNINTGNKQHNAELRQRYVDFYQKSEFGLLYRPWEKFFYDLVFSGSWGALMIFCAYRNYLYVKLTIKYTGLRGFYHRVLRELLRLILQRLQIHDF